MAGTHYATSSICMLEIFFNRVQAFRLRRHHKVNSIFRAGGSFDFLRYVFVLLTYLCVYVYTREQFSHQKIHTAPAGV